MAESTGSMPPALASKPALNPGGRAMLQMYDVIDQSRGMSEVGPQAITVTEILSYLEIARITGVEDRLLFLNTVKTLDVVYLNHNAEQRKK